ncbi:hypothetical protein AAMO2058_000073300 [Amorphochlora amoebiformis]
MLWTQYTVESMAADGAELKSYILRMIEIYVIAFALIFGALASINVELDTATNNVEVFVHLGSACVVTLALAGVGQAVAGYTILGAVSDANVAAFIQANKKYVAGLKMMLIACIYLFFFVLAGILFVKVDEASNGFAALVVFAVFTFVMANLIGFSVNILSRMALYSGCIGPSHAPQLFTKENYVTDQALIDAFVRTALSNEKMSRLDKLYQHIVEDTKKKYRKSLHGTEQFAAVVQAAMAATQSKTASQDQTCARDRVDAHSHTNAREQFKKHKDLNETSGFRSNTSVWNQDLESRKIAFSGIHAISKTGRTPTSPATRNPPGFPPQHETVPTIATNTKPADWKEGPFSTPGSTGTSQENTHDSKTPMWRVMPPSTSLRTSHELLSGRGAGLTSKNRNQTTRLSNRTIAKLRQKVHAIRARKSIKTGTSDNVPEFDSKDTKKRGTTQTPKKETLEAKEEGRRVKLAGGIITAIT